MFKKYFKGLSKDTFLLTFTSLFADISTEMLYPILPIFITQYLGAKGSVVGLIDGISTATQYIVQGLSGYVSDKVKKRKPLAVFGYTVAAISKPLIGLSTGWSGVLGARFLDRLGSGTRSAPRDALIAGSAEEAHRGKAFGVEGIGDNLGAFLGPLISIALLYYFKVPIKNIFFFALIPGLLAVVTVLLVKEKKDGFTSKSKIDIKVKFSSGYYKYLFATFIFGIGNISSSFMILQVKNIGTPLMWTIFIYAIYNLVAALVSFPSGALSDKIGRKNLLFGAFMVFLFSLMGFTTNKNLITLGVLFALYGVYQGIFRAVGKAMASDFAPQQYRATAIGWYNAVIGISGLIASIMAGQIYDKIGHSTVFATAVIFVAIGSVLLLVLKFDGETRKS